MLALALASFRGLLIVLAASLTVSPTSILPEQPPRKKKKRKEIYTKQAFVFVQWSGCSAMRTRAYKPRGSSRGGAHSTLPQQLPSGHGGATGAGSLIEEEAEGLAHKMLWQSTALGRCVELQCSAGQTAQRRTKTTSLKSSFVWPNLRTTLLIV